MTEREINRLVAFAFAYALHCPPFDPRDFVGGYGIPIWKDAAD